MEERQKIHVRPISSTDAKWMSVAAGGLIIPDIELGPNALGLGRWETGVLRKHNH